MPCSILHSLLLAQTQDYGHQPLSLGKKSFENSGQPEANRSSCTVHKRKRARNSDRHGAGSRV